MIELRQLSFRYGHRPILQACSQTIPHAAVCVGPNGCGKTTLLRLIAGTLEPDAGQIFCNDKEKFSASCCFSDDILFDNLTVLSHFHWIARHAALSEDMLCACFKTYELTALLSRCPASLSCGDRQWISLALTCLMPADLLLLDEPFQHLDPARISRFCTHLEQLADSGTPILLTAHEPVASLTFPTWDFPAI